MKRFFFAFVFVALFSTAAFSQQQFTASDMLSLRRLADPQLSPDGRTVIYTVGTVDKAANRVVNQIWSMSIDGSGQKQLTNASGSSSGGRWSPNGQKIAYNHAGQIWTMDANGGDKQQLTRLSTGASGPVWGRDMPVILFTSEVYPECKDDACNKAEAEKEENSKVQAKVTDRLLFKHWNEWRNRKRTHVFSVSLNGSNVRDLTPGDFDAPPYGAASGVDYTAVAGLGFVYLRNPDKVEAISTNSDIFVAAGPEATAKNITAGMNGYDASPVLTPDGKYLLFRSQQRAAFEADRWRIMRYQITNGEIVELTRGFDQQVSEMVVSADSKTIYFTAGERGREPIFSVPVEPDLRPRIATHVKKVVDGVYATSPNISPDGKTLIFAGTSLTSPNEVMSVSTDGTGLKALTSVNRQALAPFRLRKAEELDWRGALNAKVHGFIVKPANFDPAKKYPLIVLIHGGPQGAWNDSWSTRWNPQVWANQGYVIFAPNPRGSTGYGQKFVDEISGDWGGKVMTDISNGIAEVIKRPYVDKTRIGAAGASYGGYAVNWLLGHNNDPRFKFKAFLSHAGVYNLESMATATEEIWFTKWEFQGMPWDSPVQYAKWSPNKFVKNFSTPTLVTAGELDYRVPVDQSLQLYTTLQLRGVESKLIIFPDEGHWILKPQNSQFWHDHVMNWFNRHLKP